MRQPNTQYTSILMVHAVISSPLANHPSPSASSSATPAGAETSSTSQQQQEQQYAGPICANCSTQVRTALHAAYKNATILTVCSSSHSILATLLTLAVLPNAKLQFWILAIIYPSIVSSSKQYATMDHTHPQHEYPAHNPSSTLHQHGRLYSLAFQHMDSVTHSSLTDHITVASFSRRSNIMQRMFIISKDERNTTTSITQDGRNQTSEPFKR